MVYGYDSCSPYLLRVYPAAVINILIVLEKIVSMRIGAAPCLSWAWKSFK